jgi:hypothetical protein
MSTTGDNVGVHDSSRGWIWYWDGGYTRWNYGYNYFSGDVRTWRYYDHDTGYYFDGNDYTNLNYNTTRSQSRIGLDGKYNTPRSDYTGDSNYWQGVKGWGTSDMNGMASNWGSGFWDSWSWPGNRPNDASSHWVGMQAHHYNYSNSYNFYGWQMAMAGENGNNRFYWRTSWNSPRGWSEMLHGGNYSEYYSYGNGMYVRWLEPYGVGGDSGNGGHAYRIFQEGGGWGYPYPDLRIAYHTGIKLGANAGSYEGVRLYSDYDMSGILIQLSGSSNYSFWHTWRRLEGYHGTYSWANSAHWYPNNASYGSWRVAGTRNGWAGIEFDANGAGQTNLMCNSSETGWHNNSYGWHFLRSNGTGYIMKGYWGGSTQATILDSSNQGNAWALNQNVATYTEPSFNVSYFYRGGTSRYTGQALLGGSGWYNGVWEVRADFGASISGGESGGIAINGDWGMQWSTGDWQHWFMQDEDNLNGNYIAYVRSDGAWIQTSDARTKFSIRPKVSNNFEYIDRLMLLEPITYVTDIPFDEDDSEKKRMRKIAKMLDVKQGFTTQQVEEVFPRAVDKAQLPKKFDFEITDETRQLLYTKGITDEDIEKSREMYLNKYEEVAQNSPDGLNYSALTMYTILAIQDFKKMYDDKVDEIEVMKAELAAIKAQLGI